MLLLIIAINTKPVQNWLVHFATEKLSKQLGTTVTVKKVDFSLFNKANIMGVFVADKKNKDTILYAGSIDVNITDWFFFKDKTELKKLQLNDAVVKMNRTDSVWNYQFIINHFTSTDTNKSSSNKDFEIKEVGIKNLRLIKDDNWRGEIITLLLEELKVTADSLLFKKNKLHFNKIALTKPYINIQKYKGTRPDNYVFPSEIEKKDTNPLKLYANNVHIEEATLAINHHYGAFADGFDGAHILLSPLEVNIDNLNIEEDVFKGKLNIKAKERSGLEIKSLTTNIKWTPKIMELANLDLKTNKSHIKNYYAMKYKNFDDDFSEYETNVTMDARFKSSYIHSDDIAFFAPALKTWKKELQITGDFLGTVADFSVEKLVAKEKSNATTIAGSFGMKGLPDIDKTFIKFNNGSIRTVYKDLAAIIPALKKTKTPNIAAMGVIEFDGNFNGTISNFNTNGKLSTSLGSIVADLTMKLPEKAEPTYKGEIKLNNFDFKTFINNNQFGIIDFDGKFDGKSFSLSKLNTKLEGFFKQFSFNGYDYKNITTNGSFLDKYFNGEIKVNDDNFNLNGIAEANFSKPIPSFNILADISKSNLQALNLSKTKLFFKGLLDVNFEGTNIDNFLGTAKLLNAQIANENQEINFDSLSLKTKLIGEVKYLNFVSNDFNVNVEGKFSILDLPASFQSFLHQYYPSYVGQPVKIPTNQAFKVSLTTRYIEPYLQLFDKNIIGFNDASLIGSIDTKSNLFGLNISLPYGKYKNYVATDAIIEGKGNRDSLNLIGDISNFQVSDSFSFPNTNLQIVSSKDISDVKLKTRASNTLNEANFNAILETSPNGVKINFNPSSFILNDKQWNLDKEGEITLYKNFSEAKNVKFIQGFQEISIETAQSEGGNSNTLDVKLKDVVAGDIASLFLKNMLIEGILNGAVHVDDIFGNLNANADLKITELSLDKDSIGTAIISANYNNKTKQIQSKIISSNQQYNFTANATFNLSDTAQVPVNTTIDLRNSKIDIVQRFIGNDIFSNLNGYANGNLTIRTKGSDVALLGKVDINNTSLKVNFTQVTYKIDSATIAFEEDGIDFGEFIIKDTIGNTGIVNGKLKERYFKNMAFDFDLFTNKMLLINTKLTDNEKFFGTVIGKSKLSFKGPEENCILNISGEPTEASKITIPNKNGRLSSDASFIVFKEIGTEMINDKKESDFNLTVNLDVMANDKITFDVILDENTGDVITAKGRGRLKISVGTNKDLDMRGRLTIQEGNYNFNWQSVIKKPFQLRQGENNFIEWNGNPYDANMHIEAVYEAKNISTRDLIGNNSASFSAASKNFRDDVYVISTLSGKLMQPEIKFRFDFPANSPIKNDDVFERFRKRIEADDNEMIKQVAYLIVFNSFAPYGEQSIAQTNFTSIGVNTISSLVTKEINKSITNLLYKITKDKSLFFDLSSAVYSSNDLFSTGSVNATSTQFDRYNVKVKVAKSFLDDKLRVNFGSDFDINLRTATQTGNFQWLPDVNVQWSLNETKNLLLVVFNKNSLDISGNTLGRRTRQGVGITYKKDFDINPFKKEEEIK
jgi:hypothetical protein